MSIAALSIRIRPCALVLLLFLPFAAAQEGTLERVRERGALQCGVNGSLRGFSLSSDDGIMRGFDADVCRAIAAAVLGDASAVVFVPLSAQARFDALRDGDIDVLVRNTTWTSSRDATLGIHFTQPIFYDGQGIVVRRASGIRDLGDFAGRTICVQQGTTTELNLADQMRLNGVRYSAMIFVNNLLATAAYAQGLCDAFTTDKSGLVGSSDPSRDVILDLTLSKEPLAPAVRSDDDAWFDVVQWVVFALVQAEEFGIGSADVAEAMESRSRAIRRFVGAEGSAWQELGLEPEFVRRALVQVGNYGEIYDRNLGPESGTYIPRGLNRLWSEGGLLYAPPLGPN